MRKQRTSTSISKIRKSSNRNLMNILLKTKKFVGNNINFTKKTNETEDSDFNFAKNNFNNDLPLLPSSKKIINNDNIDNYNLMNFSKISQNSLNNLLFNSMNFDKFLKEVSNTNVLGNTKDILPPLFLEEKKDFLDYNESTTNINNNWGFLHKNNSVLNKHKNFNNKNYLYCLETLGELKLNRRRNNLKEKQIFNENNKEGKYNISRNIIFRDIILNESSYRDLYYDNSQYLMDSKYYNEFIRSIILKYRKEIPTEEEFHRTFEKVYENSEYNKPKLTLNSLSISFKCRGKFHLFHIPFELLPIFYYQNMANLKYLFISIIRFSNDFEDISLDFEELSHTLSYSQQFEFEDNDDGHRMKKKLLSKEMLLKSTKPGVRKIKHNFTNFVKPISTELTIKKPLKINRTVKKHKTIRILNGINISAHNKNKSGIEKIYNCPYNKFISKWKTPKYEYDVEINAPEVILQIGKVSLRAYVDIEYILNFIENDYENWDFYASEIIFSYKECVHYLNEIIALKNYKKLSLKKSYSQPLFKNLISKDINKNNNDTNRNIYLSMEKIQTISEKSKLYEFFYTDKNCSNYIKIFHNFSVTARCKSFKINNKFVFDFNFFQMKILNQISKIQGLDHFIKKLIYIDKFTSLLKFGYDELNTMAYGDYKYLAKHDPNKDATQTCVRMKEIYKDIINITITFPFLETIRFDSNNYQNCFESDINNVIVNGIPLDVLDELNQKDFKEWPKILINKKF